MAQVGVARGDDLTPEQQDRVRRAWRRRLWLVLGMVPVGGAAGVLGAWLARRDRPAAGTHPAAPWWVVPLIGLVVVLSIGGSLVVARQQYTRPGRVRSLVAAGDPKDIRRVAKLVRRGERVPEADRPLAQAYVDLLPRQVVVGLALVVMVVLELPLQLRSPSVSPPAWVFLGVGALGGAVVAAQSVVARRRAAAQGIVPTPRRRRRP